MVGVVGYAQMFWENILIVCALLVLFSYGFLSSAGYIMTTVNYIYTLFALLLTFLPIKRVIKGFSVNLWWIPITGLAILYTVNHDQTAVALILLLGGVLVYTYIYD